MPAAYLSMKQKFINQGMSMEDAEARAAAIYNSKHKKNPVTRHENIESGHEIGQEIAKLIEEIFRNETN